MRHHGGVHEVQYRPVTFVCTVRRFCGVKMPTNLAPLTLPYPSFSPLHLSITTYYRHSLRRFLPVFAGAPMSYNGNAAGYRHNLFERLAVLAKGGKGSRIDSCKL